MSPEFDHAPAQHASAKRSHAAARESVKDMSLQHAQETHAPVVRESPAMRESVKHEPAVMRTPVAPEPAVNHEHVKLSRMH